MRRVLEVILCIFAGVFLFGIIAIAFQVIGEDSPNKASIIGGILSMIGGALGALGAYIVATYQMNKQFEHEKKKEEIQRKENILNILKILEQLYNEAMKFIRFFNKEFSEQYSIYDAVIQLKFKEKDLLWIVNNVNSINYEILKEDYSIDYLKFSREINNMHIDIAGIEHVEGFLPDILSSLIETLLIRNEKLISFDLYVKERITDIQKQMEDLG